MVFLGSCRSTITYIFLGSGLLLPLWYLSQDKEILLSEAAFFGVDFQTGFVDAQETNSELFHVIRKCAFVWDKYNVDIFIYSIAIFKDFIEFVLKNISRN